MKDGVYIKYLAGHIIKNLGDFTVEDQAIILALYSDGTWDTLYVVKDYKAGTQLDMTGLRGKSKNEAQKILNNRFAETSDE
jgi:hypothetical protein